MISGEERYQWLRRRIKIVNMVSMSGKMKPGLYVCLGAVFLDTPFDGTEKDAVKLDTAIDAAILTTGTTPLTFVELSVGDVITVRKHPV